jgi:hypothetical protein
MGNVNSCAQPDAHVPMGWRYIYFAALTNWYEKFNIYHGAERLQYQIGTKTLIPRLREAQIAQFCIYNYK